MAEDLTHLARSEIFDSLGDKAKARSELEAVTVDETTPAPIVEAYYQHADAFYRQLDDREALVAVCRQLSANGALRPDEQLRYARAAVRAMVRGLPYADADARLARERAGATARESELVFAIDLARDVLAIRDSHAPQAVGDALLALYAAQTRPGRRRALIVDAVQRADDVDADDVLDALVQRDIQDVKRGTHERGEAEDIYERLILARAYERAAAKHYDDARDDFDAVAEQTGSLEAVVGAIDMRLKMGRAPGGHRGTLRQARDPSGARALRQGVSDRPAAPEARRRGPREGRGRGAGRARRFVVGAQGGADRAGPLRRAPSRGVPPDRGPRDGRAGQRALPGRARARGRQRPLSRDDPG